jgi:hypothetical protein
MHGWGHSGELGFGEWWGHECLICIFIRNKKIGIEIGGLYLTASREAEYSV